MTEQYSYDSILSSSNLTKPLMVITDSDTNTVKIDAAELSSANFDGGIPRVRSTITYADMKPGYYFYLNSLATDVFLAKEVYINDDVSPTTVTVLYIDNDEEKKVTVDATTSVDVIYEDWDNKELGLSGWTITSGGNAIFSNIAARGRIEATEGYFGNGNDVWTINQSSIVYSADTNILNYAYDYNFETDVTFEVWGWQPTGTISGGGAFSPSNQKVEGVSDTGLHSLGIGAQWVAGTPSAVSNIGSVFQKDTTIPSRFLPSDFGLSIGDNIAFSVKARSNYASAQTIYATIIFYNSAGSVISSTTAGSQSFTGGETAWKKITTTGQIPSSTATFELSVYSGTTAADWIRMDNTGFFTSLFYIDNFALVLGSTTPDVLVEEYEISLNATSSENYAIKILNTADSTLNFGVQPNGTTYSKLFTAPTATFEDLTVSNPITNAFLYFQNQWQIPSSINTTGLAGALVINTDRAGVWSGFEDSYLAVRNSNVEIFRSNQRGVLVGSSTIATSSNPDTTTGSGIFLDINGYMSTYATTSAIDTVMFGIFSNYGGTRDRKIMFRSDGRGYFDDVADFGAADYAEYFEWEDGNLLNENRTGKSVVLVNGKIRIATELDSPEDIIGIVSNKPAVVGDSASKEWHDKYLKDDFKNKLYTLDENGGIVWTLNPDYNPEEVYIPREDRPEWDAIGLVGKLRSYVGEPKNPRWIKLKDISENVEEWLVR